MGDDLQQLLRDAQANRGRPGRGTVLALATFAVCLMLTAAVAWVAMNAPAPKPVGAGVEAGPVVAPSRPAPKFVERLRPVATARTPVPTVHEVRAPEVHTQLRKIRFRGIATGGSHRFFELHWIDARPVGQPKQMQLSPTQPATLVRATSEGAIQYVDPHKPAPVTLAQFPGTRSWAPTLSPQGDRVVFLSNHGAAPGFVALWQVPVRRSEGPSRVARAVVPTMAGGVDFTPDGRFVVATLAEGDEPLCLFPVDLGRVHCVAGDGLGEHRDPRVVADEAGLHLVAAARPTGGHRNELVVYTLGELP